MFRKNEFWKTIMKLEKGDVLYFETQTNSTDNIIHLGTALKHNLLEATGNYITVFETNRYKRLYEYRRL